MNAFDNEAHQRKGKVNYEENNQIVSQIKKPSSFIIIVLVAVVLMLACQIG